MRKCRPNALPAETEKRPIRERWPFGQTGRIQHAELFALLAVFQIGGHLGLVPLLKKIVVEIERGLIVPRQGLKLLLDRWAKLEPALVDLDLPLKLLLLESFLANGHFDLMKLCSKLLDLWRFDRRGSFVSSTASSDRSD